MLKPNISSVAMFVIKFLLCVCLHSSLLIFLKHLKWIHPICESSLSHTNTCLWLNMTSCF